MYRDETDERFVQNDELDQLKEIEILRAETKPAKNVDPILRKIKLDSNSVEIPVGEVEDHLTTNNKM